MLPLNSRFSKGLKTIAVYEAAKGLLVIIVGLGLLGAIHRDLEEWGEDIIDHLHFNPASHFPQIFLQALDSLSPQRIKLLALGAALYSLFRFVEAYGLWYARRWAEIVAIASCAIYVPVEVYHLVKSFSWVKVAITLINIAMIFYLVRVRQSGRTQQQI